MKVEVRVYENRRALAEGYTYRAGFTIDTASREDRHRLSEVSKQAWAKGECVVTFPVIVKR